jgi:hypothetical protein
MYVNKVRNLCLRTLTPYYFITFPKSGRTWAKSFLANYYACWLDLPLFYDFSPLWRQGRHARMPRIIFTHAEHRDEPVAQVTRFMRRIRGKRVILLARDPRYTVFTYYYRLVKRMQDEQVQSMTLSEFIRHPDLGLPRIVRFLNEWYNNRENFNSFIMLRYEDCVRDPHDQYLKLLQFLRAEPDEACIKLALQRSVDTTRKIEEGGLVRDVALEHDIARGSQYFEANNGDALSVVRYAGDDAAYAEAFSAEDLAFMDVEINKLDPAFGYSRGVG